MLKIAKKKLMFIIPSLVDGGAEKVLVEIVNHLDATKYEISLVLFEKKGVYLSSIPNYVKIYSLKKKSRYSVIKLIVRLTKLFRRIKPDTALSFMEYADLIAIYAKLLSLHKFNVIISIHNYLSSDLLYDRYRSIKSFLCRNTFKYADNVIVPSQGLKYDLTENYKLSSEKIKVIYNPLDLKEITNLKKAAFMNDKFSKYIIACGRLTKQKDYPHLLKAYSLIYKNIEEKLVILGEGEDEEKLNQLVKKLGIQGMVFFLGFQKNPYKFMKNATIFVLSSLWEGFAIVIAEAMACAVPVISTDCPSGPGEIITNGENGILVTPGNEKDLADAMLTLIRHKELRKKFSEEGKKRSEDFMIEKILPQYERLF